jgi:hypothetical protein
MMDVVILDLAFCFFPRLRPALRRTGHNLDYLLAAVLLALRPVERSALGMVRLCSLRPKGQHDRTSGVARCEANLGASGKHEYDRKLDHEGKRS